MCWITCISSPSLKVDVQLPWVERSIKIQSWYTYEEVCFLSLRYLFRSLFSALFMFMLTFLFLVGPLVLHKRQRGKSKLCFWRHARCRSEAQCSVFFPGYIVLYHNAVQCMSTLHSWQKNNVFSAFKVVCDAPALLNRLYIISFLFY